MTVHRLIVLRHAKAASPPGVADIDRPLAGRGRRDAAAVGERLRDAGQVPDHVVCSPSLRTRQTFDGLAIDVPVEFEPRIYDNDLDTLLAVIAEQPEDVGSLMLIGHNPSMWELVDTLSGERRDAFPTAAFAVIDIPGQWGDVG